MKQVYYMQHYSFLYNKVSTEFPYLGYELESAQINK